MRTPSPVPTPGRPGCTGLVPEYFQLVQAAVYHADGMWGEATFDLYVKEAPLDHGFMVAAGIGPAIQAAMETTFSSDFVTWLRAQPHFARIGARFFDELADLHFEGDILAVPEGTVVFPGEPLLRLSAPLTQAGLFGAGLIQLVSQATGVATRAARLSLAAKGRPVLDFGSRRTTGPLSAWSAARAAWIGGVAGTTNAGAAASLGIPVVGVIGDTLGAAYDSDRAAWSAVLQHAPAALELNRPGTNAEQAAAALSGFGADLRTVRLDDPDLVSASQALRAALDAHGLERTRIMGSGGLDELVLEQALRAGAVLDEIGIGSGLMAGEQPAVSYRMAELVRGVAPEPVLGAWASPWPGRKQIVRLPDHDVICEEREADIIAAGSGQLLLQPRVLAGEILGHDEPLVAMRARRAEQVDALPLATRRLMAPDPWPVLPSERLVKLRGS